VSAGAGLAARRAPDARGGPESLALMSGDAAQPPAVAAETAAIYLG
jgi:hypothetical protein